MDDINCPFCGSPNHPARAKCWNCQTNLDDSLPIALSAMSDKEQDALREMSTRNLEHWKLDMA